MDQPFQEGAADRADRLGRIAEEALAGFDAELALGNLLFQQRIGGFRGIHHGEQVVAGEQREVGGVEDEGRLDARRSERRRGDRAGGHVLAEDFRAVEIDHRACIIEPTDDDAPTFREASIFELLDALKKVIERTGAKADIMSVTMEHLSVKDRINQILERLEGVRDGIEFEALFDGAPERLEIITTFLAILELIKMQALKVYQNANFGKLFVYAVTDDEVSTEPTSEELTQE